MQSHCMTITDMIYHVKIYHPRLFDDIITDAIQMMIEQNIIRESFTVNGVPLYSNLKNQNIIQKIWTYLIQMNYSTTYTDIVNAFGMTAQHDIADAIGILIAKNIIIQNQTYIYITKIERKNIIYTNHNASK